MSQQSPTTVVMEACYSSHYWGREIAKLGHDTRLIPAQHVTPFVRENKNDHNDAFAIAEASERSHIRFVPIKSEHQQEISCLHRIRERLIKNKVAVSNQIRGLLSEFGAVFPCGTTRVGQPVWDTPCGTPRVGHPVWDTPCGHVSLIIELENVIGSTQYSARLKNMMKGMLNDYNTIIKRVKCIETQLRAFVDNSQSGQILRGIPGIGIINASAFLAAIDKGQAFNNPREFAVWLGLTPKQYASGNVSKMRGITKRGDRYLRKQLIHGTRIVVSRAAKRNDPLSVWAMKLHVSKSFNKVAVAVAHRLARLIWILLSRQEH